MTGYTSGPMKVAKNGLQRSHAPGKRHRPLRVSVAISALSASIIRAFSTGMQGGEPFLPCPVDSVGVKHAPLTQDGTDRLSTHSQQRAFR